MGFLKSIALSLFLFLSILTNAQKKEKIKLERADLLQDGTYQGKKINKFFGNVVFSHNGSKICSDSAYQFKKEKVIIAFGNVYIFKSDSVFLKGNYLRYNVEKGEAVLVGDVVIQNNKKLRRRNRLKYKL